MVDPEDGIPELDVTWEEISNMLQSAPDFSPDDMPLESDNDGAAAPGGASHLRPGERLPLFGKGKNPLD